MSKHSIAEQTADTLHERATRDVPYDLDLWPQISSRAQRHQGTYPRTSRLPFRRPGLVVATYLAVLVIAVVTTFGLAPTLKSGGQPEDPTAVAAGGTQQAQVTPLPSFTPDATATQYAIDYAASNQPYAYLDRTKYGKYLAVSQTSGDYTLMINWMYVDGNVMLIDFDLAGPLPDDDSDRRVTPYLSGVSVKGGPPLPSSHTKYSGKVEANRGHYLIEKDVAGLLDQYDKPELSYNLPIGSVNVELDINLTLTLNASETRPRPVATSSDATPTWAIESQEVERVRMPDIAGPFNFQLRVPFMPARVAKLLQTASISNIDISLQQFRVSPAQIRSIMHFDSHDRDLSSPMWQISAGAQVNDWDALHFRTGKLPYGQLLGNNSGEHTIYDNVYDEQGEWTFTVRKLLNNETNEVIEGPWVFKIVLPSATPGTNFGKVVPQSPIPSNRRPVPTP